MTVFNRRNALVGFVTLKALERRRNRRGNGLKIAGFVVLGLVSVGILAGVAAVMLRRRGELEDVVADVDEIVGEYVTNSAAEPIPAT